MKPPSIRAPTNHVVPHYRHTARRRTSSCWWNPSTGSCCDQRSAASEYNAAQLSKVGKSEPSAATILAGPHEDGRMLLSGSALAARLWTHFAKFRPFGTGRAWIGLLGTSDQPSTPGTGLRITIRKSSAVLSTLRALYLIRIR